MTSLKLSYSEQKALETDDLQSFKYIHLLEIKDKVSIMLSSIGQVEGIFSTYTKHDISHVNTMLLMLDWIIPPSTREKMTTTDWLLIVLAIYMHDLGMVVTSEEFRKRESNELYLEFRENLQKDENARDYLYRIDENDAFERERFFIRNLFGHSIPFV